MSENIDRGMALSNMNTDAEVMLTFDYKNNFISFITNGIERVRICNNGDFIVNGKVITNDMKLYEALEKWLGNMGL